MYGTHNRTKLNFTVYYIMLCLQVQVGAVPDHRRLAIHVLIMSPSGKWFALQVYEAVDPNVKPVTVTAPLAGSVRAVHIFTAVQENPD